MSPGQSEDKKLQLSNHRGSAVLPAVWQEVDLHVGVPGPKVLASWKIFSSKHSDNQLVA